MEKKITYFKKSGPGNTDELIKLAKNRAKENDIKTVLVASGSGESGVKVAEAFKDSGINIVIVTYHFGFREPGVWTMKEKYVKALTKLGACMLSTTHALSGIERSFTSEFGSISRTETVAAVLRSLFGQGIKVCVEISVMAADGGFAPIDEDIIAMGGTGKGLDTACVIRPANMNSFFDLKIKEIICIPGGSD
jgi:hypothetical protein